MQRETAGADPSGPPTPLRPTADPSTSSATPAIIETRQAIIDETVRWLLEIGTAHVKGGGRITGASALARVRKEKFSQDQLSDRAFKIHVLPRLPKEWFWAGRTLKGTNLL